MGHRRSIVAGVHGAARVTGYPHAVVMSRMTDQIGRVLSGRYRLIAPVGTGASAQVFLADDVRLRRRVAVKLLHAALADDETFLRRFRAEAQAAAALNHPNILAVYDWGDDDGAPYLVTEYLGGGSLRSVLDQGDRLTPSQALLIGLEATRALEYAHRRGFVHRDVKPANLIFGEDARLRIADFGLARALAEAAWTEPQGAVLGTARYASPEQAKGESVDGKADVYSLGLVLIEAVTGSVPFAADTTIATLMARVGTAVEVPDELGPLQKPLRRAGLPDAAERPDATELAVALMACAEELPRPEPLPLAVAPALVDLTSPDADRDATLLGVGASRVEAPGDRTALDLPVAVAAAPRPPGRLDDDLAIDVDDDRPRQRWPWLVVAAVLAALLGGGGAWAYVGTQADSYEVPPLVGLGEAAARDLADGYGWAIERREDRRDDSEPGEVLATRPEAGELLGEDETLVLVVSLGNTLAPVPTDLPGRHIDEATALLAEAGGFVAEPDPVFHEEIPEGMVIALGPDVPAELPKESAVPLVVSAGPAPRAVPADLAGGTYEDAAAAIEAVQLVPARIDEFSDDVEAGRVIGTRPAAGSEVPRDGTVEVVVSRGPDLVEVPGVSGMRLEEAIAALERAGFVAGEAYGPVRGRAFQTDPPAGTEARRGSTVDIYLRR